MPKKAFLAQNGSYDSRELQAYHSLINVTGTADCWRAKFSQAARITGRAST